MSEQRQLSRLEPLPFLTPPDVLSSAEPCAVVGVSQQTAQHCPCPQDDAAPEVVEEYNQKLEAMMLMRCDALVCVGTFGRTLAEPSSP